ncbi:MAG: hypothetical protein KKC46_00195 [Proteobacteria bacterium]|nr:hypothetical protein [Pseudomonadota bacterium]
MIWIDTLDIRSWANRRACQEALPQLVRKLIRATSHSIKSIKFPSGDNVLIGGWDGILEVTEETEYLPSGISVWEFGANKDPKGKADDDYTKRSKKPLGFNPSNSTFVFVTPRLWTKSNEWIEGKKKDNIWKDIKVISAELLEEWLENAPTVSAWLAIKHLGKYPSEGIQPTEDFWEEWSSGPQIKLNPQLLISGRKKDSDTLFEFTSISSVTAVQGASREEALAFIISCFINDPSKEEDFFARSLIVDNPETFRQLSVHDNPLILIPRFDDTGVINRAIVKGHTVISPIGADSTDSWSNKIILPKLDRDSFIESLVGSGISKELAEKYSKESARNITILRRQLEFVRNSPEWAKADNVREIIPALIAGRWDENYEQDRNVISRFSGESYEDYIRKLKRWVYTPDSPIVQIGSSWRLTSPLDSWVNASRYLTRKDFELLHISFLEIMSEIDPAFDLKPEERYMASIHGKTRQYSGWIREGIVQSLILVSVFGDKLKLDLPLNGQLWVDRIIAELLNADDSLLWKSIERKLPLLAEASPTEFLNAVEKYLAIDNSPIVALFDEEPGFLTPISHHTGLLWALENIAWLPEYLSRAAIILSRLSVIDPGGKLLNRPINSLTEIFKPWHYQTLANLEERIEVLKLISEKEKEIAWTLLCSLLPRYHGIGHPTHKMRWRIFNQSLEMPITYKEIWDTHTAVVEIILSIFNNSETELSQLIDESVNLSPNDRDKLLSFIESILVKVTQANYSAWHTLRKLLSKHRSYPDAEWSLPEAELIRYEKLYWVLQPEDEINKSIWMFDDYRPDFPEGSVYKKVSHDEQRKVINVRRKEGLNNIYKNFGIAKIKELISLIKQPWIFGDTLAYIIIDEVEVLSLCEFLNKESDEIRFVHSFIFRKSILEGINWVFDLYKKLKQQGLNNKSLAQLFIPLDQNKDLWDFIDTTDSSIREEYWLNVLPHFYHISADEKVIGLKYLIEYKRYYSAIDICSHFAKEIPSNLIVEILEKAGTERANENIRIDGYDVNQLFEALDGSEEIEPQTLIKIEWLYLPVLVSCDNERSPKLLHGELSKSPDFFIEVLNWIYTPDNDELVNTDIKDLSDEQIKNRAKQAYELLLTWKQIPGVNESGKIDSEFLNSWVKRVRKLAGECGRIEVADMHIGQVLAQSPKKEDNWPPDEICFIIESINTDNIKDNFVCAVFNQRGTVTKSPFEGGEQERKLAKYFNNLATNHKNKFPIVASVLVNISKSYEQDAKREDERAEKRELEY